MCRGQEACPIYLISDRPQMVVLHISMEVLAKKRQEFSQAILPIIVDIRQLAGCRQAKIYHDLENDNRFFCTSYWNHRDALNAYLRSEKFRVLLGTRFLLTAPHLVDVDTISSQEDLTPFNTQRDAFSVDNDEDTSH